MSAIEIDVTALEPSLVYKLLVGAVQPRPIAWVSTVAPDGGANLAPFSFFTVASRYPATVVFSVGQHTAGRVKDTLVNLRGTGDFVVNIASFEHNPAVAASGTVVDAGVDEFELAGLTAAPSVTVQAPRVAEAQLALECRLHSEVEIGADTCVFGTVLVAHAADGVFGERMWVDNDVLRPLGRLAGPWFTGPLSAIPESSPVTVSGD